MMLPIPMQLETLASISPDDRANGGQADLGHLIVSWAGQTHLTICFQKETALSVSVDQTLSLLWTHQLHSLDEWGGIQIAINKHGNICFLYRLRDTAEPPLEQIREVIRAIQYAMTSVGLQIKTLP